MIQELDGNGNSKRSEEDEPMSTSSRDRHSMNF